MRSLRHEINSLFDRVWEDWPQMARGVGDFNPSLDLTEEQDEYLITAEIPGVEKEDLDISLDNRMLTIRGEKKEERKEEKEGRTYHERRFGRFQRSVPLPSEVEEEKIKADLHDGVLRIRLPKSEEAKKQSRQITVESS